MLDGFFGGDPNRELTAAFDGAVSAFAFDTNRLMGNQFNIVINFASGSPYGNTFSVPASEALSFFGFQSNGTDIISVVIDGDGDASFAFILDNFRFTTRVPLQAPLLNPAPSPFSASASPVSVRCGRKLAA